MRYAALLSLAIICSISQTSNAQLVFNFSAAAGTPQQVIDGFEQAGSIWSSMLNDNVTVDIAIDFPSMGGMLGGASSTFGSEAYSDFTTALAADVTSAADVSSVASLQSGATFSVWSNLSAENPNGAGSTTPYFDDGTRGILNNAFIIYTSANARAIGISTDGIPNDGSISFSSDVAWDFDPSDGIASGSFDFVGVATHEIAHILGFNSGVDNIDANPGGSENNTNGIFWSNPIDLFRFSADSLAQGAGIPDMTSSMGTKFFSVDAGATSIAEFSEGTNFGDGLQASHWKLGENGLMVPLLLPGVPLSIAEKDLLGVDVIGWDRFSAIPEPGSTVFLMIIIAGLATRRSRA